MAGQPKTITLLGATGSVGESVLSVIESRPLEFRIDVVVANNSATKLADIARRAQAKVAVVADPASLPTLKAALEGSGIEAYGGSDAVLEAAARPVDLVFAAIVGAAGIRPTWSALTAGNMIALANKECLVSAGDLFIQEAQRQKLPILPVDSEHNAVWQVFDEKQRQQIDAITLTASGGPFRNWSKEQIAHAKPNDALNHPTWNMGAKVTIDSASLMNKGLELIEAKYLFSMDSSKLNVLVHPQSIVHGLVHYSDGSVLAHLGCPDMRVPVASCLNWPGRGPSPVERLNLAQIGQLSFEDPDTDRFPCLSLAYDAMTMGNAATNVLNAADEIAVSAFLQEQIEFGQIAHIIDNVLNQIVKHSGQVRMRDIDDVLEVDQMARQLARQSIDLKRIG